jgi:hypothetical protein
VVSNLVPRQISGVGPESAYIDSHLLDKNGRVRDLDVVSRELHGDLPAQFAYVDYELGKHLRRPMARGYPPKIFISYRRKPAENIKWCADLAGELRSAGYEVMLDALAIPEGKPSPELLARFVGQLAAADVALMVLNPEATSTEHGIRLWMYEEWYRISALHTWGLLEIVGVIRERKTENPIIGFNPGLDPLIDLSGRNPADRRPVLEFFGKYRGLRIPDADQQLLAQNASACIRACGERDEIAAATHLARITRFPETEECRVANVAYHAAFRSRGQAINLAQEARAKNLTLPASAELAQSLWTADIDDYAFRGVAEIAELTSWWRGAFHFIMGDILAQRGFLRSALNHLSWCVNVRFEGSWQQLGRLPEELIDQVHEDMRRIQRQLAARGRPGRSSPEHGLRDTDRQCDICKAQYSSSGSTCALCGALHARGTKNCEMCLYGVVPFPDILFCPVCRTGFESVQGVRRQHQMMSRVRGGRYSVLWPYATPTG